MESTVSLPFNSYEYHLFTSVYFVIAWLIVNALTIGKFSFCNVLQHIHFKMETFSNLHKGSANYVFGYKSSLLPYTLSPSAAVINNDNENYNNNCKGNGNDNTFTAQVVQVKLGKHKFMQWIKGQQWEVH